jgi:hypothetical protein
MRLLLSLALVAVCTLGELLQHAPKETPIVDAAAGADFIARSEVDPSSSGAFRLTNTIRNRATTPLAVHWPAGGFYCAGSHQIPRGATQYGTNTGDWILNPTPVPSDVKYGAKHQYQRKADVFIEPKAPESAQVSQSEYYLEDEGRRRTRRILVTARRDGEGAMTLSLEMPGGMLLAVPLPLADPLRQAAEFKTGAWKDLDVVSPSELVPPIETFGGVATQLFGPEVHLISSTVPVGRTTRITARQSNVAAVPRPVYFALIDQQRTSVTAFRAFVFAHLTARAGR